MIIPSNPLDLVILLLTEDEKEIKSIVHLDKMLHILHKLNRFPCVFNYIKEYGLLPHYGPFTHDLLTDLQALQKEGMIQWNNEGIKASPFLRWLARYYTLKPMQRFQINLVRLIINDYDSEQLLKIVYHEM